MSGRWVPPLYGALRTYASPGSISGLLEITDLIASLIDPRWIGRWGALAMSSPEGSNTAQLKSSRSLMFTDTAVFSRTTPICSAMFIKRLLKISNWTGLTSVPTAERNVCAATRSITRFPLSTIRPCQSGSMTVVAFGSTRTAGPLMGVPGVRCFLSRNGVSA